MRKLLTLLVWVVALVFSPTRAYAANETYQKWDGSVEAVTPTGDTYAIQNAAQLAWLAQQNDAENGFAGKTIQLEVNVDLGVEFLWTAIGSATKPFAGTFDGQGHLVRGLGIIPGNNGIGLFGHIGQNGKVNNLGISGGTILAEDRRCVGAIAGVCAGAIHNCWSMAMIKIAGNVVGGLVGELTATGSLTDVYCAGLILTAKDTIGGLVGWNKGTIKRAYFTGYAKNGNGIVGEDNNGTYYDCFYDRKLYYPVPGVWNNDNVTPIDVTEEMFDLFAGNATWTTGNNAYPQLTLFSNTDASQLSVAPMFINTTEDDPINHANDLTEDFSVSTSAENGTITWKCQDASAEEWIQFNGGNVTVVRPCAETDVLVDASLGNETHTIYLRPRRVEDLQIGNFPSSNVYLCYKEEENLPSLPTVINGTVITTYHYKVVLMQVDPLTGDETLIEVLANDDDPNLPSYEEWKADNKMPTSLPGDFVIRLFVHDDGCVQNWKEAPNTYTFHIYEKIELGTIPSNKDTMFLSDSRLDPLQIEGTPTTGGKGTITYQWKCNGNTISGATDMNLSYPITATGTYVFTRYSFDEKCHIDGSDADNGQYQLFVMEDFDPGKVNENGDAKKTFCTVTDAKGHTITGTSAKGALPEKGYEYQWFKTEDGIKTLIPNSNSIQLSLASVDMAAGKTYIFTREARNQSHWTTWTACDGQQEIQILKALNTGAIETRDMGKQCVEVNATTLHIVINETQAADGEQTLHYQWKYRLDGTLTDIPNSDSRNLDYHLTLQNSNIGKVYTFLRYVRQGDCDEEVSNGSVTVSFGRKEYHERTVSVCENALPYHFVCYDSNNQAFSHDFTADGQTWLFTDNAAPGCPSDTLFTVEVLPVPVIAINSDASLCQESGRIILTFEQISGTADVFHITFSPDLAQYVGVSELNGTIASIGTIVLTNIPSIGEGDCYMIVEVGNSGSGDNICYSASHTVSFNVSLGGYVHSKYDRVLFVDNNPNNGEVPQPKLSFKAYQWYKDGQKQIGQTDQYYHEDGTILRGTYFVEMIGTDNLPYRSCEVTMPMEEGLQAPPASVYPVPVNAGGVVTIECDDADVRVLSTSGEQMFLRTDVQVQTSLNAPTIPGFYIVQIEHKDGRVETEKLIVK